MSNWINNLTAQSGNFSTIQSLLTQANGVVLNDIYNALESWVTVHPEYTTMNEIIADDLAVSCEEGDVPGLSIDSVASLQALGLIKSQDSRHIAPTALGWQFIQAMRSS